MRTLIVDDEAPARRKIRHFLELDPDIEWIGECANGEEAFRSIQENHPDVLFLDIQMPLIDGFTFLKRSGKERPFQVIFVTAYDEYAVRAFEAHAADYLLKPFTKKRFQDAVARIKQQVQLQRNSEPLQQAIAILNMVQEKNQYLQRIPVKVNQVITFLPVNEIDWIETQDNYVLIHVGKSEHLVRDSLNSMERELDPSCFLRIHRRIVVNAGRIREMRNFPSTKLVLKNGDELPVSRRLKDQVKRFLLNKKS